MGYAGKETCERDVQQFSASFLLFPATLLVAVEHVEVQCGSWLLSSPRSVPFRFGAEYSTLAQSSEELVRFAKSFCDFLFLDECVHTV